MPHSTPNVIFFAPVEPWARENGSSVVIADLLQGLHRLQSCPLLPMFLRYTHKRDAQSPHDLHAVTLDVRSLPRWFSILGAVASRRSPWELRIANRSVARSMIRVARENNFRPTVVHVEHLPLLTVGRHVARAFQCALVYRAHNIESTLWKRRLGGPSGRRPGFDWLLRRAERQELRSVQASDLTLCISGVDQAWIRERTTTANVDVLPPAIDVDAYARYLEREPEPNQICFVGGLDWGPNETGLRWFVERVLPQVRSSIPEARLAVLARGAHERDWIVRNPGIRIIDSTESAPSLFAASKVSIAPLLEGGGVRIKILESLAVGCPVVATLIGGEGLELAGLTRTDDPPAFARACVEHLRASPDPGSRRALSADVRKKHGSREVALRLVTFWKELHAARAETGDDTGRQLA